MSSTEQVGVAKVVNVGHTSLEQVGSYKKIAAGEITIAGTKFNFISTGPVQVRGAPIDLN